MIYLISGRPRSGKSYESVKYHVIPALKERRKVITNLPLNVEYIAKFFGRDVANLVEVVEFDYSDFDSAAVTFPFSRPEHYESDWRDDETNVGPLFVIDEAHFSLPRGGTHASVKKYFTMHGHYGVDILLMTQHPRQLDADILNLIEVVYRTVKNTALGSTSTYTKKVQDGYRGDVVNTEQRKYDKSIFKFYKSHTQSNNAVSEAKPRDIKGILRHWSVIGGLLLVPVGIVGVLLSPPLSSKESEKPVTVAHPAPAPAAVAVEPPPARAPVRPQSRGERLRNSFPFEHPYDGLSMHITGHYWTAPDQSDYTLTVGVSRNGHMLFETNSRELARAGYDTAQLSECALVVQWGDYSNVLTCDTPTVSLSVAL